MSTAPVQLSKFLSFVLRHRPDSIGLMMDSHGWVQVDELISKGNASGISFDRLDLMHIVETSEKKRFSISEDRQYIRAAQGHSVAVKLGIPSQEPPSVLYHGTAMQFEQRILSDGIKPQSRQQVHLSSDEETAFQVGQRHGKPVVLQIKARDMQKSGFEFFMADNGVWLTDYVPPEFLIPGSSSTADSATTSKQPKPSR